MFTWSTQEGIFKEKKKEKKTLLNFQNLWRLRGECIFDNNHCEMMTFETMMDFI